MLLSCKNLYGAILSEIMCLIPYIFSLRQFVTEFAAKCIFLSTMSRCLCVRIRRQPCSPFWKADDNVGRGRRCSEKWSTAAAFGFFWANERPTINWKAVFNALSQPARGSKSNERELRCCATYFWSLLPFFLLVSRDSCDTPHGIERDVSFAMDGSF